MAPAEFASRLNGDLSHAKQREADAAPRNIFPDGIKTSDQLEPIYSLLRPYVDFPEQMTVPQLGLGTTLSVVQRHRLTVSPTKRSTSCAKLVMSSLPPISRLQVYQG